MRIDIPQMFRITKVIDENPTIKTFVLDCDFESLPGQFVNVWIPRLDEKPMSISYADGQELHISIAKVGPFSKAMHELKEGDQVGLRGPYGNRFTWKPRQKLIMISGGCGRAPLNFVARQASQDDCQIEFITGARSKDLLMKTDEVAKLKNTTVHIATDDGSVGHKGFGTEILEKLVREKRFDTIMTCGPELMMLAVTKIAEAHHIDAQISMERFMKCGFGLCGQCAVDPTGDRLCQKGPVVSLDYVKQLDEFGKYHRDALGKKISL